MVVVHVPARVILHVVEGKIEKVQRRKVEGEGQGKMEVATKAAAFLSLVSISLSPPASVAFL